jgi:aminoglycoside 6'-N-acetyltransferase I
MIKRARIEDAGVLADLAIQMWTGHVLEDLTEAFRQLAMNDDAVCFIKSVDDKPIGFAQCQLRHDYVEGCETSPVGYLEGLFVAEAFRGTGVAKALLARCEAWARECGCAEFASDCELTNTQSIAFHKKVGFAEENRIVCFKKEL